MLVPPGFNRICIILSQYDPDRKITGQLKNDETNATAVSQVDCKFYKLLDKTFGCLAWCKK